MTKILEMGIEEEALVVLVFKKLLTKIIEPIIDSRLVEYENKLTSLLNQIQKIQSDINELKENDTKSKEVLNDVGLGLQGIYDLVSKIIDINAHKHLF